MTASPRNLDQLVRDGYTTRGVFAYVGAGFELLGNNFTLLIAFAALLTAMTTLASLVPFAGPIALILLTPPLYGGLYLFLLKRLRNQPVEFNDFFAGFNFFWSGCYCWLADGIVHCHRLDVLPGSGDLFGDRLLLRDPADRRSSPRLLASDGDEPQNCRTPLVRLLCGKFHL